MDEPYTHGAYISMKHLNEIAEAGTKLSIRYGDSDRNQQKLTKELNDYTLDCTHDLNKDMRDGTIWLGTNVGIEPYILEYMSTEIIADLWSEGDEYVRKVFGELLVYVKMKEADRIAKFIEKQLDIKEKTTAANIQAAQPAFRKIKDRYSTRTNTINNEINNHLDKIRREKVWFIGRVNRALALAGRVEHMCEDDQKIVKYLEERDFLGKDGPHTLINQDKIQFMDAVEFGNMIREITQL